MQFVVDNPRYAATHRATNWARDELDDDQLMLMDNSVKRLDGEWPRIAVVMASGPSMCQEDADDAAGADCVIAVNSTWQLAPWADHLFVNDERWFRYVDPETGEVYHETVKREFAGETWCGQIKALERGDCTRHLAIAFSMRGFRPVGHHMVCGGNNSGHTALNLAAKMGFANIILLGFDMQGTHWHGQHPGGPEAQDDLRHSWIRNMNELAIEARKQGYTIINASRETALECFPRMSIKDALLHLRASGSHRWMPALEWAQTPGEEKAARDWCRHMGWENL